MGWKGIAVAAGVALAALAAAGCSDGGEHWDEDCGCWVEDEDDGLFDVVVAVGIEAAFGDDDEGEEGDGPAPAITVRSDLLRGAGEPDPDGRGAVRLFAKRRRAALRVDAARLDPWARVELLVADGAGTLRTLGFADADESGAVGVRVDGVGPPFLPGAGDSLAGLAGREVAIRDGLGRTLLRGRVPSPRAQGGARRGRADDVDPVTGVRLRGLFRVHPRRGRQVLDLRAEGLPTGAEASLWIRDAGGHLAEALRGTADGEGRVRFRADSRRGDPLPLGVLDLGALSGRECVLRAGGVPVLEGNLPALR